jgi:hypothetical protein
MLSDRLVAFVRSSIKSVWALELLFFLRARRAGTWDLAGLARELRASEPVINASLATFRTAALIRDTDGGRIQFAPAAAELDELVRELADVYATRPSAVIDEIYAPQNRLQHFADAFRLKKD